MIFIYLIFQIHNLLVLLVAVVINGVKKQVPQVSYKTTAGDLIPFHSFGSILNLFRSDLLSNLILFGSYFKIQKHSVMLVVSLTNSGVKNQVPHFLLQIYWWGFGVSFLLWGCWYFIFWIIIYLWSYIRLWSLRIRSPQSQGFSTFGHMLISSQN